MKTIKELKNSLNNLLADELVSLESKSQGDEKYARLLLLPGNADERNSLDNLLVKPQYVGKAKSPDESDMSIIMRRLLMGGINVNALDYAPQVSDRVRTFLTEVSALNHSISGNESLFESLNSAENSVIKCYQISAERAQWRPTEWSMHTFRPTHVTTKEMSELDFFVLTAHVPVPRDKDPLETAFSLTQNHEASWSDNPALLATVVGAGSSSKGDIFVMDDQAYCVVSKGFIKIAEFSPAGIFLKEKGITAPAI
jgi:hypothetical protein